MAHKSWHPFWSLSNELLQVVRLAGMVPVLSKLIAFWVELLCHANVHDASPHHPGWLLSHWERTESQPFCASACHVLTMYSNVSPCSPRRTCSLRLEAQVENSNSILGRSYLEAQVCEGCGKGETTRCAFWQAVWHSQHTYNLHT